MGQGAAACGPQSCKPCNDVETTLEFDAAASSSRGIATMRWDCAAQAEAKEQPLPPQSPRILSHRFGAAALGTERADEADLPSPPSHTVRCNPGGRCEAHRQAPHGDGGQRGASALTLLQARLPLRFHELDKAAGEAVTAPEAPAVPVPELLPAQALLRARLPLPLAQLKLGKVDSIRTWSEAASGCTGSTHTPQVLSSASAGMSTPSPSTADFEQFNEVEVEAARPALKKGEEEEIMQAIRREREARERVRVFLAAHGFRGACAKKQRLLGYTFPLHTAVFLNDAAMVLMLLKAGADERQTDSTGRTPYQLALYKDDGLGSHKGVLAVLAATNVPKVLGPKGAASRAGSSERLGGAPRALLH